MGFTLNPDQEFVTNAAVDWFFNSNDQVFQYDGPPGSGKSVVLNEIVKRIGLNINTEVAPMSFIGAASLVMRTKGLINSKTAHSWCYEVYNVPKRDLNGNIVYKNNDEVLYTHAFKPKQSLGDTIKLIIVDEAFCMPRSMRPVIEKFGIKILACGDQDQLPPVKDKPAFLIDGKIYHLTQVMRQAGMDDIIYIANRARLGLPLLNGYYGNSLVIDRDDLTDSMLLWADAIICCTNKTRDKLNKHIRYIKGYPNSALPNYGERVVCRSNNWDIAAIDRYHNEINLVNGLIGTIVNQPSVSNYDAKTNTFNLRFTPDLAPECVFDTKANYDYMVADSKIRPAIKEDPYEIGDMFELAYAITCHIAQVSQFHRVIYIEESMPGNIQSCLNLVGATRADQQLIYVKNNFKAWKEYNDPYEPLISPGFEKRLNKIKARKAANKAKW